VTELARKFYRPSSDTITNDVLISKGAAKQQNAALVRGV
jgi:hypothetical protein